MEVVGVQQHQIIQVIFRQMMEVVLKGSLAGVAIGSLVVLGILPSVIGKLYLGQAEELEGISFYQPVFFLIAILPVAMTLGVVILLVKQKSQNPESSGMYELWNWECCREETNKEKESSFPKFWKQAGSLSGQKISVLQ